MSVRILAAGGVLLGACLFGFYPAPLHAARAPLAPPAGLVAPRELVAPPPIEPADIASGNVRVSRIGTTDPEEPTIAINPANPNILIGGANLYYFYYSTNAGASWTQGTINSSMGVWGDPSSIFDLSGNAYYGHLSNPSAGYWLDRVVVQKSVNGGATWNDGAGVSLEPPTQEDKEWLATDMTNSPWRGNVYMSWTQFTTYGSSSPTDSSRILFSRTTDAGATWSTPVRVSDVGGDAVDSDQTAEGAVPAVGPQGQVYVSWARNDSIWFNRSTDGGLTFGSDRFVSVQPGGWDLPIGGLYRANGLPITACDVSNSPYRGRVYVCWSDQRNGAANTDVFLAWSDDGGVGWTPTMRVNQDSGAHQQFFPWMCVDPTTGHIFVVYYDRRNTTGNATDVYISSSTDGGATFTDAVVSASSFTPNAGIFFGDYIDIVAYGGKVHPIWTRMDGNALSIWTTLLDEQYADVAAGAGAGGAGTGAANLFAPTANPWRPGLPIAFALPEAGRVRVSLYGVDGRLVRTLVDDTRGAGLSSVDMSGAAIRPGVYFLRLAGPHGIAATRKLVVAE